LLLDLFFPIFFAIQQNAPPVAGLKASILMSKTYQELAKIAKHVRFAAHAPYSGFHVGAALLTKSGKVFTGCNIENSSYGLTICAERTAIFKAVSEGERDFRAIAVASDDSNFTPPCGACRQVLIDLAGNIDFVMVNAKMKIKVIPLNSLIPMAFTNKTLHKFLKKKK
jgi:cytidine deaminase